MYFMAWAYLIAFGSTWVVAGIDDGPNGELRHVGLTLLGLAWILGLGMSLHTLFIGKGTDSGRKDDPVD